MASPSDSDDVQADTAAHGGPDKAIYAYAAEDDEWWQNELEQRPRRAGSART